MQICAGWLQDNSKVIRQVATSNFNARPQHEISLIVLHNISLPPGEFGGGYIDALFTKTLDPTIHPFFQTIYQGEFSTHIFIARTGQITQYVSFLDRAWHAGRSAYLGQIECNDYSVGIELEGTDDLPFTDAQYQSLNEVITVLTKTYTDIQAKDGRYRIAYHSEIAPNRKTDPGAYFDESRLCVKRISPVFDK